LGQGSQSTAAAIYSRNADGENGNQNDDIHEAVKPLQAGVFTNQDKRRGIDIDVRAGAEQVIVIVRNQQAHKEEAEDVESGRPSQQTRESRPRRIRNLQSDSPEHLLDGARQRLDGVMGLGSRKTNQLSTAEGEGRLGHE
jgi:hypothetical protein